MKHPKTKKAAVLRELLEMSYSMDTFPDDAYALEFDRIMAREKDLELYDALTDLDGFLFG